MQHLNLQATTKHIPEGASAVFFHRFCGIAGYSYLVEPLAMTDGDVINLNIFYIRFRLLGLRLLHKLKLARGASEDYLCFSNCEGTASLDDVLGRLVSEGAYAGSGRALIVDASTNHGAQQRDELWVQSAEGMVVATKFDDTPASSWQLTEMGKHRLRPLQRLEYLDELALARRTDAECPLVENHIHELLTRLAENGFEHKVHNGKKNHLQKLCPYNGHGPKEFWAHKGDTTISKWYLLALLLQDEKQWSV